DASERIRPAARLGRAAQIPCKLNCALAQAYQAVIGAAVHRCSLRTLEVGLHQCPSERNSQMSGYTTNPFSLSRPASAANWRNGARLFACSPGVNCRDRLTAGGRRIRTLGPSSD